MNLTTNSGTNTFHGAAWWFNRNDAFTALNAFQPRLPGAKPPRLNRNQYGANVGGPVWRNKTFFFFNWESGRQIAGSFGGQALIPPSALRTGDFSAATAVIRDPETGQPFPGNRIPTSRIRPYASKFLDQFVHNPTRTIPALTIADRRSPRPSIRTNTLLASTTRSTRDSLYGSYIYNIQSDDTVPTFGFDSRGNRARAQNASLTELHIFSNTVVNEVRAGWLAPLLRA